MTGDGNTTYLLVADGDAALVDAGVGHPEHVREIGEALLERRAVLRHVLVTHGHADHASGAPELGRAHPNARFAKHPWLEEDAAYDVAWVRLADDERLSAA